MSLGTQRENVKIAAFLFNDDKAQERLEYEAFLRSMLLNASQVTNVNVCTTKPDHAMLHGVQGIVIGGSRMSVWEDVPNAAALAEIIRAARAKKTPIIGVCFGAQFLAHIFGGKVVRDHGKEERGTYEITTSDDSFTDMLFADAPFKFMAQCAHHDCITTPPAGAVVLASSELCPVQAFTIPGTDVYGVQFHPERNKADYVEGLTLRAQKDPSFKERAEAIATGLQDTPEAELLLAKFIDRIVLHK